MPPTMIPQQTYPNRFTTGQLEGHLTSPLARQYGIGHLHLRTENHHTFLHRWPPQLEPTRPSNRHPRFGPCFSQNRGNSTFNWHARSSYEANMAPTGSYIGPIRTSRPRNRYHPASHGPSAPYFGEPIPAFTRRRQPRAPRRDTPRLHQSQNLIQRGLTVSQSDAPFRNLTWRSRPRASAGDTVGVFQGQYVSNLPDASQGATQTISSHEPSSTGQGSTEQAEHEGDSEGNDPSVHKKESPKALLTPKTPNSSPSPVLTPLFTP